jgi:phosphatidate cytidylyltransferase
MSGAPSDGPGQPDRRPAGLGADFLPRLVSGLGLAAVALFATWWGPVSFALLVALVAVAMSWEWGRIVRGSTFDWPMGVHAVGVLVAIVATVAGLMGPALIFVLIGAIVTGLLAFGRSLPMSIAGVFYVGLPAVALVWLRGDPRAGLAGIAFLLAIVWATDVGAYLVGRTLGGPRLWPRVSPGKTWSGLVGGVALGGVAGAMVAWYSGSRLGLGVIGLAVLLALVSQGGDLAESALKRSYGVKDASALIPGHGGFLDRVDGLVAAAAVAGSVAAVLDVHHPARALLDLL